MGKAQYSVIAIKPGRQKDYADFWTRKVLKNEKGEDLHSAILSIDVEVRATNSADAEKQVRAMHPDHTIDPKATQRLG